jgi:hypothetical protein
MWSPGHGVDQTMAAPQALVVVLKFAAGSADEE